MKQANASLGLSDERDEPPAKNLKDVAWTFFRRKCSGAKGAEAQLLSTNRRLSTVKGSGKEQLPSNKLNRMIKLTSLGKIPKYGKSIVIHYKYDTTDSVVIQPPKSESILPPVQQTNNACKSRKRTMQHG